MCKRCRTRRNECCRPVLCRRGGAGIARGRLIIATILLVTIRTTIVFMVAGAFAVLAPNQAGWRWTIRFRALPVTMQAAILVFMPDTPRWLVMVDRLAAARRVIQRLNGDNKRQTQHTTRMPYLKTFRRRLEKSGRHVSCGHTQEQVTSGGLVHGESSLAKAAIAEH